MERRERTHGNRLSVALLIKIRSLQVPMNLQGYNQLITTLLKVLPRLCLQSNVEARFFGNIRHLSSL